MNEVFPVMAGVLVGAISLQVASFRLRMLVIAVLGVVFGVAASSISGELAIGWEFILVDIPLVIASAVVTVVAVNAVRFGEFRIH